MCCKRGLPGCCPSLHEPVPRLQNCEHDHAGAARPRHASRRPAGLPAQVLDVRPGCADPKAIRGPWRCGDAGSPARPDHAHEALPRDDAPDRALQQGAPAAARGDAASASASPGDGQHRAYVPPHLRHAARGPAPAPSLRRVTPSAGASSSALVAVTISACWKMHGRTCCCASLQQCTSWLCIAAAAAAKCMRKRSVVPSR